MPRTRFNNFYGERAGESVRDLPGNRIIIGECKTNSWNLDIQVYDREGKTNDSLMLTSHKLFLISLLRDIVAFIVTF